MNISIRDVAGKPEWLAKVSAFLHDAAIPDSARYDEASHTLTLALSRIGYDFRVGQSSGFFTTWRMPTVPAVLTVTPVVLLTPEEEPDSRWDGDQLVEMTMPTPGELQFTTRDGVISVRFIGSATLAVSDSGPPDPRLAVTDWGALILPRALIDEIVNATVV